MAAIWPTNVATDADLYVAKNALRTTLATALGTGDTSVVLASASGFPVAGAVVVDNEVIFYTSISGATLTSCTRGADGTTAATHSVGVPVGAAVVAFHHNGLMAEIEAIETYLNTVLGKSAAVTAAEFAFVHGVTSAIQTQIDSKASTTSVALKAPIASPTFTGTVVIPSPFTLGGTSVTASGAEMNFLVGVSSAIQTQLGLKAPLASPTFSGVVTGAAGSAGSPSFAVAAGNGIYSGGTNILAFQTNSLSRWFIDASGNLAGGTSGGAIWVVPTGSDTFPDYSISGDTNTGWRRTAADTIAFITNAAQRFILDAVGNVVVGTAAIATNATDGFLYLDSCAGTPTGTPTAYTGRVPMVVDTTNSKIYVRIGSSWKSVTVA